MDVIAVALVRRAHGLDGELLVQLLTGDPETVFEEGRVFLVMGGAGGAPERLTLEASRRHRGGLLLAFREIADRAAAERLRGLDLAVPVDELRELAKDEFFLHDLVGYVVVRADGSAIGAVATVYETGGQMLLGVAEDGREVLVPFGRQVVMDVDRDARRIVIDPPPGLLEV
jgi:16S rRNA processing protein RimM